MIAATVDVTDEHGADHRLITFECDGPDCNNRTTLDPRLSIGEDQDFHAWATVLGFDDGNAHLCSMLCLKSWAQAL